MQNFCTRCGNLRSAQALTCPHCGKQYDPVRTETERVEVARPEAASPPAEQPEEYWLGAPPTFAEPTLQVEPPTLADQSIPVYQEPQPTSWDYGAPRGPALGDPGRGDSAPPSWAGFGYYEEPQRLPAEGGEPFWGAFQGSPATPQPDLAAPPYPETAGYPQAQYPQQGQYPQQPLAQPAPRQPASHRLVPAHPAPRGREQPPSRWSLSGRPSGTLIAAAALLVLACGGGAYAAVTAFTGHSGKPGGHPAVAGGVLTPAARSSSLPATAPASTLPASAPPSSTPATSPPASTSPPSTSPPAASTPPAASGTGSVAVSATAQSNAAEPQVLAWVESYFTAINTHDYQAYISLLSPQLAANYSATDFANGYGSTKDTAATLTSISDQGGGEAATVSFTSYQDPSQSVNGQDSCDSWTITLYLVPSGGSYVEVHAPAGYTASYRAC